MLIEIKRNVIYLFNNNLLFFTRNDFKSQLSNRKIPARGGDLYKKYNNSTIFTENNATNTN